MWLLSTDRAELHYFPHPTAVAGGYAILSHTWNQDGSEQTFQDIHDLGKRCKADGTNPRDFVSSKIRGCCVLAEHHGYDWAWVDSCCIDKTNPAELSEAINSMFQWYSQAEVCYVYLVDVPSDGGALNAAGSAFRKSRWHSRGWTLQELIAPVIVIFLSKDWTCLGRRGDPEMAELLEDITGIPESLLMRSARFYHYSVAQRMFWASKRSTTRLEDEAYCLMGLFNVNMPTLYGEGRRAFQRLQLEIMKNSSDTSLFAWGERMTDAPFEDQGFKAYPNEPVSELDALSYLLARSPSSFQDDIYYTPSVGDPLQKFPPSQRKVDKAKHPVTGPFDRIELPRFTSTSYGIECRFPIFEANGYTVAVLLCETGENHLGLLLSKPGDTSGQDPTRPLYFTSAVFIYTDESRPSLPVERLTTLGDDLYNLHFNGGLVKPVWRTVYIIPSASDWASPHACFTRIQLKHTLNNAFRVPHWLIATFSAIDFQPEQESHKDTGPLVDRLQFSNPWKDEWIYIDLGLCERAGSASVSESVSAPGEPDSESQRPAPPRWANVYVDGENEPFRWLEPATHDCLEHHIEVWPLLSKVFSNGKREIRVSFNPCRINPETTLVLHLELLGPVYEKILRAANVTIPAREKLRRVKHRAPLAALGTSIGGVSMPPAASFASPTPIGDVEAGLASLRLDPSDGNAVTTNQHGQATIPL